MAVETCDPNAALLRDNFATQTVQAEAFSIVIDLGTKDPITDMPMVYVGDIDMFDESGNNGSGRIQSISPSSLGDPLNDHIVLVEHLSDYMKDGIDNPAILENLDAIRSDLVQAADLYICATESQHFKEVTEEWREEWKADEPVVVPSSDNTLGSSL